MNIEYQNSDKQRIRSYEEYSRTHITDHLAGQDYLYIDTNAQMMNNNSIVIFTHTFRNGQKFIEFSGYIYLKKRRSQNDIGYIICFGTVNSKGFRYYEEGFYSDDNEELLKLSKIKNNGILGYSKQPNESEILTSAAIKDMSDPELPVTKFLSWQPKPDKLQHIETLNRDINKPELRLPGRDRSRSAIIFLLILLILFNSLPYIYKHYGRDIKTYKKEKLLQVIDNADIKPAEKQLMSGLVTNDVDMVYDAVRSGADYNFTDGHGTNLMLFAAGHDMKGDLTRVLAEKGVSFNSPESTLNTTPLLSAAFAGNIKMLRLAEKYNGDFNVVDTRNKTLLINAAQGNQTEVIKFLLARDVINAEARDRRGLSALDYAKKQNNQEAIDLIRKYIDHHK